MIAVARDLPAHHAVCEYRRVLCDNVGCGEMVAITAVAGHAAFCSYRVIPCPLGYCGAKMLAKDAQGHAQDCVPTCRSGHAFPVCDFRCLRRCYPTKVVRVFNNGVEDVELRRGVRFDRVQSHYPTLQHNREDKQRLGSRGFVVSRTVTVGRRAWAGVHLEVKEAAGAPSKMMASPVRVHWATETVNRFGQFLGACTCSEGDAGCGTHSRRDGNSDTSAANFEHVMAHTVTSSSASRVATSSTSSLSPVSSSSSASASSSSSTTTTMPTRPTPPLVLSSGKLNSLFSDVSGASTPSAFAPPASSAPDLVWFPCSLADGSNGGTKGQGNRMSRDEEGRYKPSPPSSKRPPYSPCSSSSSSTSSSSSSSSYPFASPSPSIRSGGGRAGSLHA